MGFEKSEKYVLGEYRPRAFRIRLHVPTSGERPDELEFNRATMPLLMHEVGHLIQDRSTLYGKLDFLCFLDSFAALSQIVRDSGDTVSIPLRHRHDEFEGIKSVAFNIEQIRRLTYSARSWGENETSWAYQNHRIVVHDLPTEYGNIKVPEVRISLVITKR